MKTKKTEIVQRINSQYVGDDCIQVMIPYDSKKGIGVFF